MDDTQRRAIEAFVGTAHAVLQQTPELRKLIKQAGIDLEREHPHVFHALRGVGEYIANPGAVTRAARTEAADAGKKSAASSALPSSVARKMPQLQQRKGTVVVQPTPPSKLQRQLEPQKAAPIPPPTSVDPTEEAQQQPKHHKAADPSKEGRKS
jgi:hypothetical protein